MSSRIHRTWCCTPRKTQRDRRARTPSRHVSPAPPDKSVASIENVLQTLISELNVDGHKESQAQQRHAPRPRESTPKVRAEPQSSNSNYRHHYHHHRQAREVVETIVEPSPTPSLPARGHRRHQPMRLRKSPKRDAEAVIWKGYTNAGSGEYDREKARADWEAHQRRNGGKPAAGQHPMIYGVNEISACASNALRNLGKSMKALRALEFAAGSRLFPNGRRYISVLEEMSSDIRLFSSKYADIKEHSSQFLFEEEDDPVFEEAVDELLVGPPAVSSSSNSSVISVESTINIRQKRTFSQKPNKYAR